MSIIVHTDEDTQKDSLIAGTIDENGKYLEFSSNFDLTPFYMMGHSQKIQNLDTKKQVAHFYFLTLRNISIFRNS